MEVNCRQCAHCRASQAQAAAVRCVAEQATHSTPGTFATLTYRDEKLWKPLGTASLFPKHVQDFKKRLAKKYGPVRSYIAGEYGERTFRPHYHALFFGKQYTAAQLEERWQKGSVHVDELNSNSIMYTCQYVTKKLYGALAEKYYKGIFPPFQLQSQSLGYQYVQKYTSDISSDRIYISTSDGGGYPLPVPATLLQAFAKTHPELVEDIKSRRRRHMADKPQLDSYEKYRNGQASNAVLLAKQNSRSRDLT